MSSCPEDRFLLISLLQITPKATTMNKKWSGTLLLSLCTILLFAFNITLHQNAKRKLLRVIMLWETSLHSEWPQQKLNRLTNREISAWLWPTVRQSLCQMFLGFPWASTWRCSGVRLHVRKKQTYKLVFVSEIIVLEFLGSVWYLEYFMLLSYW